MMHLERYCPPKAAATSLRKKLDINCGDVLASSVDKTAGEILKTGLQYLPVPKHHAGDFVTDKGFGGSSKIERVVGTYGKGHDEQSQWGICLLKKPAEKGGRAGEEKTIERFSSQRNLILNPKVN